MVSVLPARADDPDAALPPGTITNFRAETNQPYGFYLRWTPPAEQPTRYLIDWGNLAPASVPEEMQPPGGSKYVDGSATSALVAADTTGFFHWK